VKAFFVVYRFRITLVAGKGRERKKGGSLVSTETRMSRSANGCALSGSSG